MACAEYVIGQLPLVARWLEKRVTLPPTLRSFADPNLPHKKLEIKIKAVIEAIYGLARLGTLALVMSSLRALPAGSYESVSAVASIPHI